MVGNDIVLAQRILENSENNYKDTMFHNTSSVYKQSNEQLSKLDKYFKNKKDILTVIGSGDQILNMILDGACNIDAFDISSFPKYFMYLKLAAVKTLSYDEYLEFFLEGITTDEKYDDMYFALSENLDKNSKKFWDNLFNFYDWCDIYLSSLFSNDSIAPSQTVRENIHLKKDNYIKLKELIENVNIRTVESDFLELPKKLDKKYDFAYLSNIAQYVNLLKYKEKMEEIPLVDGGEALTYFYKKQDHVLDYFSSSNYNFNEFQENGAGVLVYKK